MAIYKIDFKVICPYCKFEASLESSVKVYKKDYGNIYLCKNYPVCDSYIGVHKHNNKPLGRMANKELRQWKVKAHAAFDPLWQRKAVEINNKGKARGLGYAWLAKQLYIAPKDCHIGMFDVDLCKKVVEVCSPYLKKR